ncbi:MAG: hypothetical protein Q8R28_04760, partial [Dehalococcoidia bacterium]|nr:hypothetical protein [Dehalococcoidia bacterium]
MPASVTAIQAASQSGMVRLEFKGSAGNRYIKGPISKQTYKFGDNGSNRRGFVWAADAQEMLRLPGFSLVPDLNPATPPAPEAPLPVRQETAP